MPQMFRIVHIRIVRTGRARRVVEQPLDEVYKERWHAVMRCGELHDYEFGEAHVVEPVEVEHIA